VQVELGFNGVLAATKLAQYTLLDTAAYKQQFFAGLDIRRVVVRKQARHHFLVVAMTLQRYWFMAWSMWAVAILFQRARAAYRLAEQVLVIVTAILVCHVSVSA
jgi:hypothetical protein